MRPDQCHGEPKTPSDIQPDTSLYPRWSAEWLKAALLVREGTSRGELYEWNYKGEGWICNSDFTIGSFHEAHEYRLKPKPRELWAVCSADGWVRGSQPRNIYDVNVWDANYPDDAPHTVVRFVEQP